jgi:SP family facilitated glucose transporter-like MFS transporter 8
MSVVGAILMNSFGRKTLAVVSGIGMAISMAAGGSYEYFYSNLPSTNRPLAWVPLICVLGHVCVSMMGFLQLPWMMNGELFPLAIRGVMGGIVASLAHLFIFASVKTYPDLMHALGTDGTLWFFGAAALLGAVYCYIFLPETRGKTLREIELEFSPKERRDNEENNETKYTLKRELSGKNKKAFVHDENGENMRTPDECVSGEVPQVFIVEARYAKMTRVVNDNAA